jgi:hypothetical protein
MEPSFTSRKRRYRAKGNDVVSVPTQIPAAERARWLAELSETLEKAHGLLADLASGGGMKSELGELSVRIEAARLEVQSLRLSRSLCPRDNSRPEWTESPPWVDEKAQD